MSVEKFLSFWSHYNVYIIEGLLAAVILLSLLLAFRAFFGSKEASVEHSSTGHVDATQLEKTLQKILENQATGGGAAAGSQTKVEEKGDEAAAASKTTAAETRPDGPSSEATQVEIEVLKKSLSDSKKEITNLQAKVKAAEEASQAGAASAAPAAAAPAQDVSGLMDKIRDLEARLAEYEIISEDIADLSKYREENEGLKKQLDSIKAGSAPAPAPQAAAVAEVKAEPVVAPVAETSAPTTEPAAAAEPAAVAAEPAPVTAEAPAAAAAPAPAAEAPVDLIDDELMKEFAAAVEGQKAEALSTAAEKAGDGSVPVKPAPDETSALMNDFESFVNKKS